MNPFGNGGIFFVRKCYLKAKNLFVLRVRKAFKDKNRCSDKFIDTH